MKQKRFIKLLMGQGYSRNSARRIVRSSIVYKNFVNQENAYLKTQGESWRMTSETYADKWKSISYFFKYVRWG